MWVEVHLRHSRLGLALGQDVAGRADVDGIGVHGFAAGKSPAVNTEPTVWPGVDADVQFAVIGDQVADELSRESRSTPGAEFHFAWIVWTMSPEDIPMFSLLGTTWPGKLYSYSPWHESRVSVRIGREFAQLYADAGFYELPPSPWADPADPLAAGPDLPVWTPRPAIGDPRMDPTVLEEGCWLPWVMPSQMFTAEVWADNELAGQELRP
jgi:hypothetical protein